MIIKLNLSDSCNFLFKLNYCQTNTAVYAHIINYIVTEMYVQNNSNVLLIISQKSHMKQIVKYKAENCYLIIADDVVLISTS